MKKLILTIGIVVAGLSIALAQEKVDAPTLFNRINQTCNLNDEQKAKLQSIVFQYVQIQNANSDFYSSNPEELKNANLTARHNFEDKLKSILTVVQMESYSNSVNGENTDVKK